MGERVPEESSVFGEACERRAVREKEMSVVEKATVGGEAEMDVAQSVSGQSLEAMERRSHRNEHASFLKEDPPDPVGALELVLPKQAARGRVERPEERPLEREERTTRRSCAIRVAHDAKINEF